MKGAPAGSLATIDYLQILDQKRSTPELGLQLRTLSEFAQASGTIIVLVAQIDRSFNESGKDLPDLSDIRLPNPVDLSDFSAACFLSEGQVRFERVRENPTHP